MQNAINLKMTNEITERLSEKKIEQAEREYENARLQYISNN